MPLFQSALIAPESRAVPLWAMARKAAVWTAP